MAVGVTLANCSKDGDEESTPNTSKFFAETPRLILTGVSETQRGMNSGSEGMWLSLLYNDDYRTADIWIYDIDFGDGEGAQTLSMTDVPWEFSVGTPTTERVTDEAIVEAKVVGGATVVLENLKLTYYLENEMDGHRCRGIFMTFDYRGRKYTAYPEHLYCEGTTTVESDGGRSVNYESNYSIDFDVKSGQAVVVVDNIDLGGGEIVGPTTIAGVATVFTPGSYELSYAGTVESGDYRLSDFYGEGRMADELVIELRVERGGEVYRVKSHLKPNFYDTPTVESGK